MSSSADFATPARGTVPPSAGSGGPPPPSHLNDVDDDEDLVLKVTAATAVASLANAAAPAAPGPSASRAPGPKSNTVTPSSSSGSGSGSGATAASVTPHDASTDALDQNKSVRFGPEAMMGALASSSSSTSTPAGASARTLGGGGHVYSNRGRYVSPARRSTMTPSPAASVAAPSAAATSSLSSSAAPKQPPPPPPPSSSAAWRLQQHPENQKKKGDQPQMQRQHPTPDVSGSTPGLETAVTNSPSMEDRYRRGQRPPPEDPEAEAASALAGVAAAAAAAAAASAAASENDALYEPKSPVPSLQEAGNMFLSTPKNKDVIMTPTDFSMDYGKPLFDTSNVLAWLQSPSGLFSPGFGNILHSPSKQGTPGAGSGMHHPPRSTAANTPLTPVVSTSFFFSDVAKLPKSKSKSIICISPLATASRHGLLSPRASHLTGVPGHATVAGTPAAAGTATSSLPLLSDTPVRGGSGPRPGIVGVSRSEKGDPAAAASAAAALSTLSAAGVDVHMAERDCMEDEDLTVLLQLAANSSSAVFRGKSGGSKDLGLPVIGGGSCNRNDSDKILSRKPTLEMRTSSDSGGDAATVGSRSSDDRGAAGEASKLFTATSGKSKSAGQGKAKARGKSSSSARGNGDHPFMPSTFGYGHDSFYGSMPHHALVSMGLPPGASSGTMRVVVGAPPPPSSAAASAAAGSHSSSNPYGAYGIHAPQPPHYGGMGPGMYGYNAPPQPHPTNYYYSYAQPPHPPPPRHEAQPSPWNENAKKKSPVKKTPDRAHSTISGGTTPSPPFKGTHGTPASANGSTAAAAGPKKKRKPSTPSEPGAPAKKKNRSPQITDKVERAKAAKHILAVNAASGGMNDKAATLAAAIMRGVTMRPSGKWQAQLYFAGKSRYIGVFDSREKAALAYEIAREKLKAGPSDHGNCPKSTENLVNVARKAAFDGVNEKLK